MTESFSRHRAYTIIVLLALASTLYNAFLPLHGDEAYYWVWSHHLQGGYYDHAPLIAFIIAATNFISQSEWGVRLGAVLSLSISAFMLFQLAMRMSNAAVALRSIIIFSSVILTHAGSTIITPDAPLILFWTLSLYYGYIALIEKRTYAFWLLGLFLGLMMLSKYSAILFAAFLLLFTFIKSRDLLGKPKTYLVAAISFIVITPMLWWNYQYEWISFLFQIEHGERADSFNVGRMFEYILGQFGIFSPVFAGVLFYYLAKNRAYIADSKRFYLALSILTPLLFFIYKSLESRMELNYTAPAYVGGSILLALIFEEKRLKSLFKIGLALALSLTLIVRILFITHLEILQDRMYGNKEAIALLEPYRKTNDSIYGDHLSTTALLQYYLPDHPASDVLTQSRYSQYDLWRSSGTFKEGLFLGRNDYSAELSSMFETVQLLQTLEIPYGFDKIKTFYIYRVANAKHH